MKVWLCFANPECKAWETTMSTICSGKGREPHLPETHSIAGDRGSAGSLRKVVPILNTRMERLLGICTLLSSHSKRQHWVEESSTTGRALGGAERMQRELKN